jgi:hypothetical protein
MWRAFWPSSKHGHPWPAPSGVLTRDIWTHT